MDVLCVVKAETVPVFPERIYYSTINQTRYNHVHDRPAFTPLAPLRTITTTNTGFRPEFIPSQQERRRTEGHDEGNNCNENNPLDLGINCSDALQQRYQL